jgi:hypothetical protein
MHDDVIWQTEWDDPRGNLNVSPRLVESVKEDNSCSDCSNAFPVYEITCPTYRDDKGGTVL